MPHIVGLSLIVFWSLGFLTPYSLIGFSEILLIIAFLKFALIKYNSYNFLKSKSNIKEIESALENTI